MASAFVDIAFTPSVKAVQSLYGIRQANLGFESSEGRRSLITERGTAFIAERDSFYQTAVSESDWPCVERQLRWRVVR